MRIDLRKRYTSFIKEICNEKVTRVTCNPVRICYNRVEGGILYLSPCQTNPFKPCHLSWGKVATPGNFAPLFAKPDLPFEVRPSCRFTRGCSCHPSRWQRLLLMDSLCAQHRSQEIVALFNWPLVRYNNLSAIRVSSARLWPSCGKVANPYETDKSSNLWGRTGTWHSITR